MWRQNPRESEIRWIGESVQWVISPVQVALWTDMQGKRHSPYAWRANWSPLRRQHRA